MRLPVPFLDSPSASTQVATPTHSPATGNYDVPDIHGCISVTLSCATSGSHIFYTKDGTTPTHTGDTATGTTFRIGSNSGSFNVCAPRDAQVVSIGYKLGLTDSSPDSAEYIVEWTGPPG